MRRHFDSRPLLFAAMIVTTLDACTDRYAYNFGVTESDGVTPVACVTAVPGCADLNSQSCSSLNSCRAVNVADAGSCLSSCTADPAWADSDGDGCNGYRVSSCGFDDSLRQCPLLCGGCASDVRLGCDGVAGSGATADACGVCAGGGSACASCASSLAHFCTRTVSVQASVGTASVSACEGAMDAAAGGLAVVGGSVLRAADCAESYAGFEISGFDSEVECVTRTLARAECSGETASPSAASCVPRQPAFSAAAWALYCPASATAESCAATYPNPDCTFTPGDASSCGAGCTYTAPASEACEPVTCAFTAGASASCGTGCAYTAAIAAAPFGRSALLCATAGPEYALGIALSLAQGLFGDEDGAVQSCSPECLYGVGDTTSGWSWDATDECWSAIASASHACLQSNAAQVAAQASVDGLCPERAALGAPASTLLRYTADGGDPGSSDGGGWSLSDGRDHAVASFVENCAEVQTADARAVCKTSVAVGATTTNSELGWGVEDASPSVNQKHGIYYKKITGKTRDQARSCGWRMRFKVLSCTNDDFSFVFY